MAPQAISKTLPCLVFTCNSGHGRGTQAVIQLRKRRRPAFLGCDIR